MLLEALSLWQGRPQRVVLSAESEDSLCSLGLADGLGLGEQEELAGSNGQGEDRTRFYAKFVEEASSSTNAVLCGSNVTPPVLEAVKAYVTLGQICDMVRKVWGAYREDGRF